MYPRFHLVMPFSRSSVCVSNVIWRRMLRDLGHVANGVNVAHNVTNFLDILQEHAGNGKTKISANQKAELLSALSAANSNILALFYDEYSAIFARLTLERTVSAIQNWANDPSKRKENSSEIDMDNRAYVICLRNACHNISLIEEIGNRAQHRRTSTINSLLIPQGSSLN